MKNMLQTALTNFPRQEKEGDLLLRKRVWEREASVPLTARQKQRVEAELSVIEKTGTARVFLEFADTVYALKGLGAFCGGLVNSSYLCYFLGVTKVDPMRYGLYFERFFSEERNRLPYFTLFVVCGNRERAMEYFNERYGFERVASVKGTEEVLLSAKPLGFFTDTDVSLKMDGERIWKERNVSLADGEAARLGLCAFALREGEPKEEVFLEKEIALWAKRNYKNHFDFDEPYSALGLTKVRGLLKGVNGEILFHEQFYSLCEELLGVSPTVADGWRLSLCKRNLREAAKIEGYFLSKLGEAGRELFHYIYNRLPYTVCKAYVVGEMMLKILNN